MTAADTPPARTPLPPSRPHQTFLAFDYGLKRTGVASGNRLLGHGTPLTTVTAEGDARFVKIAALIQEWQPDALVVGIPFHPDGAAHDNTRRAQRFARQLQGRFRLPVYERLPTGQAAPQHQGQQRQQPCGNQIHTAPTGQVSKPTCHQARQ